MQHKFVILASCSLLAACGTGTNPFESKNPTTESRNLEPDSSGVFTPALLSASGDGALDGYSYQVGRTSTGIGAIAGIVPGTSVTDLPTNGKETATFTGDYRLRTLTTSQYVNEQIPSNIKKQTGQLTLSVDFVQQTITSSGGDLTVAGTFDDAVLGGTVSYDGVTGALSGLMGGTDVVGSFHGANTTTVMAGGFAAAE